MCARVEHGEVERVLGHLKGVIFASDVAWIDGGGEIEEEVRADDRDGGESTVEGCEEWPGTGQKHVFASSKEGKEEYDDSWVTVIEHVVAKTLEIAGEAATGEGAVETQETGGNGIPDEAV